MIPIEQRFARASARLDSWLLLLAVGLRLSVATAQTPLSNLVVTVGTTLHTNNQDWSYVLIGSTEPSLLAGKSFAVYGKVGYPTNSGSFTQRGTMALATDPASVNALLTKSVALGQDTNELDSALNTLAHNDPAITVLPLAQKIPLVFQVAMTNPSVAQILSLLAHANPGLTLCGGQAFAERISGVNTYEVRELNPGSGTASEVLGRVTLVPSAQPPQLPAPGFPFQVATNDPSDHLRIRLRWGTSPALRRLALLNYGFNVWRMPFADAVSGGFTNNPPTLAQLHSGKFTLINQGPIMATKDFDPGHGPGSADDPSDPSTYFVSDENQRPRGNVHPPTNNPAYPAYQRMPFNDGDKFYYFVTARDILGRDGQVSNGGLAEAFRRLPPAAPTDVHVQNVLHVLSTGTTLTNLQNLQVLWTQNTNVADQVSEYWIYRWPNPSQALTNDFGSLSNRVGVVNPKPGKPQITFLDNGSDAPTVPGLSNYWYTVRAASLAAAGYLVSPQSSPAWGVLRERFGPAAANGQLLGSCGSALVLFQNFNWITNSGPPDTNNWNYRFTCRRRDSAVTWVEFFATNQFSGRQKFGRLYFPPDGGSLSADFSPGIFETNDLNSVTCVAGTYYGAISDPVSAQLRTPTSKTRLEAVFLAGQVLLTEAGQDYLAAAVVDQNSCQPAFDAKAFPDGVVRLRFDVGVNALMIQVATNANPFVNSPWSDVGIFKPDDKGNYWVPYPDCLIGPLPRFRGCDVNLSGDQGDCDRHVTQGGDGGVAPIQIGFKLQPRTHEYRLYRTVNNGPFTLIAQGAALYDPLEPTRTIVRTDNVMPPSGALLCYYVQLLDEHGNGSPMAFLGCREVKVRLPRPVLSQPQPAGDASNPQIALNWFCPTTGVYRFQLNIQRADHPGGGVPLGISSSQLTALLTFDLSATFYGLFLDPTVTVHFDAGELTPPLGPGFGPGPQFNLTASLLTNVPYHVSVAAMDDQGNLGDFSQAWTFTWIPTNPLPTVPWPARPLPPAKDFDDSRPPDIQAAFLPRVQAVVLHDSSNGHVAAQYPVGVRIGDTTMLSPPPDNSGTGDFLSYQVTQITGAAYFPPPPTIDPNTLIFRRYSTDPTLHGQSLLPIVVYRQQIPNKAFAQVSGTLLQVSPLLERLGYGTAPCPNCPDGNITVTIYDRLIGGGTEVINDHAWSFLYLRDQQPVIIGAAYRYFVVRFNEQHEISEIIPAGEVTIPSNP